jgi:hypothetical protein
MMEALSSSETSVLTRATRRNVPENGILPVCSLALQPITLSLVALQGLIPTYCDVSILFGHRHPQIMHSSKKLTLIRNCILRGLSNEIMQLLRLREEYYSELLISHLLKLFLIYFVVQLREACQSGLIVKRSAAMGHLNCGHSRYTSR